MLAIVRTINLQGLEGNIINVEVDISGGLPSWDIVGLPDMSIREARERVKTAIKNSKIELKSRKITINLSPANIKKEGSNYDLAIAVAVLIAMKIIKNTEIKDTLFLGELSLNGKINRIDGILPMCIEASKKKIKRVIVPKENSREAAIVKGIKVLGVESLIELIAYLNGKKKLNYEHEEEQIELLNNEYEMDYSEVKGQKNIKRALEISAAGGHNCLLVGSPGSGKTMMARRLNTILPDLTLEESMEITKIHSIAGEIKNNMALIKTRPFRSPHHNISAISLIGGGRVPKPGEISLAHYGVLFLDELPEFNRSALEVLREPLEDRKVTISRVGGTFTYPCNFMFIASMNPCPCGYYGSAEKECICTEQMIKKYRSRISGPLLDRIDIHIDVLPVKYESLGNIHKEETSKQIRDRVNFARKIQVKRYEKYGIISNSELTPKLIEKFCKIDEQSKKILQIALEKLGLSARAYTRILKVARTIADLETSKDILASHISEAIQYRSFDKEKVSKYE